MNQLYILLVFIFPLCNCKTATITDVMRPLDERTCVPGFVCYHGYCVRSNTLQCICDTGWIGAFCEKNCSLYCGEYGSCVVFNDIQKCVCDWQHTGTLCDKLVEPQPLSVTTDCPNCITSPDSANYTDIVSINDTIPTDLHIQNANVPAADNATDNDIENLRNDTANIEPTDATINTSYSPTASTPVSSTTSNRRTQCFPGFVCQHGYCPKGELRCVCDDGWIGPFCEIYCQLDCGEFGRCEVLGNDTNVCNCDINYNGERCEVYQVTTESVEITTQNNVLPDFPAVTIPTTTSSQWSVEERRCVPGFVCLHGYCNKTVPGYKCECDLGWIGLFCEKRCGLTCSENRICDVYNNGTAYCRCTNFTHTGHNCDERRPTLGFNEAVVNDQENPVWYWYLIGSCVFLLVVLLILLVLIPYYMWKKRDIFIMKIMYMFQPYEDDDEKLFDAFISYKSTEKDESFVLRELFPRLETENNFKLCLHFRDFVPGETISNNIIWAVENSRRTIMILSPEYVQSEFCRFEYQRAQHEMLKRKQRIIPIIFEDISKESHLIDKTLKTIINSITYLEWPGEENGAKLTKFWKRLELSLPKKRQEIHKSRGKNKSREESVKLKRVSTNIDPSSTDDEPSEFVRLSIDDETILRGGRNRRNRQGGENQIQKA